MNVERAATFLHARARDVSVLSTRLARSRRSSTGTELRTSRGDEDWRGRIISKSGIPLAGRKIKRYIGVRCGALWRVFSCGNSSWGSQ